MSERETQIRRLAEDFTKTQTSESLASWAYSRGARMPDPPAPLMPVVSEAAVQAANHAAWPIGGWKMENCLRAAWPHLLRDSLAVLPRDRFDIIMLEGGAYQLAQSTATMLARALGAAEGP